MNNWLDFVKFIGAYPYLDTDAIDDVFINYGVGFDGDYSQFIAGPPGHQYVDLNVLNSYIDKGNKIRRQTDARIQRDAASHCTPMRNFVEIDKVPMVIRSPKGNLFGCRLIHVNCQCPMNNNAVRLYFPSNDAVTDYCTDLMNDEEAAIFCPFCVGNNAADAMAQDIKKVKESGRPTSAKGDFPISTTREAGVEARKTKMRRSLSSARKNGFIAIVFLALWMILTAVFYNFFGSEAGKDFPEKLGWFGNYLAGGLSCPYKASIWPWNYGTYGALLLSGISVLGNLGLFDFSGVFLFSFTAASVISVFVQEIICFFVFTFRKHEKSYGMLIIFAPLFTAFLPALAIPVFFLYACKQVGGLLVSPLQVLCEGHTAKSGKAY